MKEMIHENQHWKNTMHFLNKWLTKDILMQISKKYNQ
jgi:hypothetical protein